MNTADTLTFQGNLIPMYWRNAGDFPIFVFPWVEMPSEIFSGTKEKVEINIPKDTDILELAKKFYLNHKETLLNKYNGKYIAIINNKVVGYNRDFSRLAQKVYKKYGYQTIFMPFVESEERVVKIPSPRIRI